ncbi:uncharacterized protein LOC143275575 [Babylonia areolata]|uniref:uncharacterized protein LOC143275575 n=1 Tax=Babylonia areolata TaxID=304850 RepID=UPI003FD13803
MCTRSKSFDDANPSVIRAQEVGKLYRRFSYVSSDYTARQTNREEVRRKLAMGSDDDSFNKTGRGGGGGGGEGGGEGGEGEAEKTPNPLPTHTQGSDTTLQLCYMNQARDDDDNDDDDDEADVTSEPAATSSSPPRCCQSRYHHVTWADALAQRSSSSSSSSSSSMSSSCVSLPSPTRSSTSLGSSSGSSSSSGSKNNNIINNDTNNNNNNEEEDEEEEEDGGGGGGDKDNADTNSCDPDEVFEGSVPIVQGKSKISGTSGGKLKHQRYHQHQHQQQQRGVEGSSPRGLEGTGPLSMIPPPPPLASRETLAQRQYRLQQEARVALAQASIMARMQMEMEKQNKKKSPVADFVGVPELEDGRRLKIPGQLLQEMNFAQLQVLVNDLHTQIESLNEELVHLLIEKDDLHMEQDSMLVDIEDLNSLAQRISEAISSSSSNNNNNTITPTTTTTKTSLKNHNSSSPKGAPAPPPLPPPPSLAAATITTTTTTTPSPSSAMSRRHQWSQNPSGFKSLQQSPSSAAPGKVILNDAVNGNE